ncbi:protein-glutamine gamma-glutamyltransferase [Aquibacillus albus]|uniref:Protein-glutamine gamma-glutamyltransferase n=1 Tax=Aquibacillus albus TaxID=1168171 RepID=A0ABS2N6C3_9BACI|nr:protein-glutamine gamma-glutamyltransferase [Aquibacillus albus]MBM7573674.1 protein-glutamine gamma-glutamyltransferase [Aquibacillus albus]
MIQLTGIDSEQINEWPLDMIESVIIHQMHEDPTVHSYQSMDELLFELKLRKNILGSAKAMNQGRPQLVSFEQSRCNPRYWYLTNSGGFQLRPDVLPSDAIQDIFINSKRYAFECSMAIVIIYYHAILNSMDNYLFNQIFQDIYLYSWHFDSKFEIHSIHTRYFLPGDVVYFNNPDFHPRHSLWRGENAIIFENGTFFAHGLGIVNARQIIHSLNIKRRPGSNQSAYLTHLVARLPFSQLINHFNDSRSLKTYKTQHPILHHNQSSISLKQYLLFSNGT